MLALLLVRALTVPFPGVAGRTRPRVLRSCSTAVVDFIDHRVRVVRAALLFTVVFTVITSILLVVLVRMDLHPLLAVEVVAAIGMLAAHVAAKIIDGSVGTTALSAG